MAPVLLLLLARDTIFSLQATFVPALVVTEGGPPPYSTTYVPLFVYRNAFEYLRYGYAAAATLLMLVLTAAIVLAAARAASPLPAAGARLSRWDARLAARRVLSPTRTRPSASPLRRGRSRRCRVRSPYSIRRACSISARLEILARRRA